MAFTFDWLLVSSEYKLFNDVHISTVSFYIALLACASSCVAAGYYYVQTGLIFGTLLYGLLFCSALLLLFGVVKQRAQWLLPFILIETPRVLVIMLLTTYFTALQLLSTKNTIGDRSLLIVATGTKFLLGCLQLYCVYIVYITYTHFKEEAAKKTRIETSGVGGVGDADAMSVYP